MSLECHFFFYSPQWIFFMWPIFSRTLFPKLKQMSWRAIFSHYVAATLGEQARCAAGVPFLPLAHSGGERTMAQLRRWEVYSRWHSPLISQVSGGLNFSGTFVFAFLFALFFHLIGRFGGLMGYLFISLTFNIICIGFRMAFLSGNLKTESTLEPKTNLDLSIYLCSSSTEIRTTTQKLRGITNWVKVAIKKSF